MPRRFRRALLVAVTIGIATTSLGAQAAQAGQPAQVGPAAQAAQAAPAAPDSFPGVTCSSEDYPQFAAEMGDFVRLALKAGTVMRDGWPREPGVAFYDYKTGTECYSTTASKYKTASLVKASILATLLWRPGGISDAERPMVEEMILESENDPALWLWRYSLGCGKDENGNVRTCSLYRNFLAVAGMDGTSVDPEGAFGDTYTTARDQVRLFKLFSSENPLISADRRAYARDLLQRAEPRFGVTSFAPPGTVQQLKVGFSKLGDDSDNWRVNSAGRVHGGAQGYDYIMALLSDRNEELLPLWPYAGIKRLNDMGEQINCGVRELNGDTSCWSFKGTRCVVHPSEMGCQTADWVRSHPSQGWIGVKIDPRPGSTIHWELVDVAKGVVVHRGDAVEGPGCICQSKVYGLHGSYILTLRTTTEGGGESGEIYNFTEGEQNPDADQPPAVDAGPDRTGDEGAPVSITGFANDDRGTPQVRWSSRPGDDVDAGGSCTFADPTALRTTVTCTDDGTFIISLTANDGVNAPVTDEARVQLANVAPGLGSGTGQRSAKIAAGKSTATAAGKSTATTQVTAAAAAPKLTTPRPWQLFRAGQAVTVTAPFVDPGSNDTQTCRIAWDDGTGDSFPASDSGCRRSHVFRNAGMYTIDVDVTDDDGGSDSADVMVVVYDPEAGWTNDDGSINTPAGALVGKPATSRETWFHLRAEYYKPADTVPAGTAKTWIPNTDFRFDSGDKGVEWLVVTPDGKVAAKGTGKIQGQSGRYGFVFYGYDGCSDGRTARCQPGSDRYRVVVWNLADGPNPGAGTVYDNRPSAGYDVDVAEPQVLRTGAVTIHRPA